MTVRCPRCGTRYRSPRGRRTESTFRCARCRHVFEAEPDEPALVTGGDTVDDDDAFTLGEDEEDTPMAEEPRRARQTRERAPEARSGGTARFAFRSMLAVTGTYAVLSVYLYTNPQAVRTWLGRLPVVGPTLVERTLSPANIRLTGVRGEYARVKGDKLVFVVSGAATNTASVPVRGIQIQARATGPGELRQVVFVGAAPREVHDLSLREIALLQTIEPPKDWSLPPGAEARFLVVFADPPADLREFTAEVVAVQAPRRNAPAQLSKR